MAAISIRSNIEQVKRNIQYTRDQLPFAQAAALTAIAKQVQVEMTADMAKVFTKTGTPTKTTLNAIAIKPARKTDLTSAVYVKDVQAKYLVLEETGGTRTPTHGSMLTIPVNIARNAAGKIGQGKIAKLLGQKGYFMGKLGTKNALFRQMPGTKGHPGPVVLVALFIPSAPITPKWHFIDKIAVIVARIATPMFEKYLIQAMKTAK